MHAASRHSRFNGFLPPRQTVETQHEEIKSGKAAAAQTESDLPGMAFDGQRREERLGA